MTDRVHSLAVVLERDIRIDDVQATINAIKQVKGVIDVTPEIADLNSHMAYARARTDLQSKLWKALHDE
jgi:hypothetical protein